MGRRGLPEEGETHMSPRREDPRKILDIDELLKKPLPRGVQAQIPWVRAQVQCPKCGGYHEVYVRLSNFQIEVRYPGQKRTRERR